MANNNFENLLRKLYASIEAYPGNFKSLVQLLDSFNEEISKQGESPITLEQFKTDILNLYPKAKIVDSFIGKASIPEDIKNKPFVRIFFRDEQPELEEEQIKELQQSISSALIKEYPNNDSWFELVRIAPLIAGSGINYKNIGFSSLAKFLESLFPEFKMEERGDEEHPNQKFVYINLSNYISNTSDISTNRKPSFPKRNPRKSAFDKLKDFAVFLPMGTGFQEAIVQLATKVAPGEQWYYGKKDKGTYPILTNYFLLTFERLLAEDSEHESDPMWKTKIRMTDTNAVFNTGLVDRLYEPIYALFKKNPREDDSRKWKFLTFVKSTDREHQTLTRVFGTDLPEPAHYYTSSSELVYNIHAEIGSYNWDHIIDRCDRLPIEFLRDNGPRFDYDLPHTKQFYRDLAIAIKADTRSYNRIKNRIEDAIEYALKRVRWNFKTAIPIYYPGQKQISLLLPLLLSNDDKIDVAIVLEATDNGAYIAHTILTLSMAYTNARLITRPDSDWLTAVNISVRDDNTEVAEID